MSFLPFCMEDEFFSLFTPFANSFARCPHVPSSIPLYGPLISFNSFPAADSIPCVSQMTAWTTSWPYASDQIITEVVSFVLAELIVYSLFLDHGLSIAKSYFFPLFTLVFWLISLQIVPCFLTFSMMRYGLARLPRSLPKAFPSAWPSGASGNISSSYCYSSLQYTGPFITSSFARQSHGHTAFFFPEIRSFPDFLLPRTPLSC